MNPAVPTEIPVAEMLSRRLVRYDDLRPCTTAFIDSRTPGRQEKENFTIIGPGVAENPDQHVHIELPHGFNIGGARQPPGCINSQHSHETAEVFVIHTGTWAFYLGPNCEDGEVVLGPGDTISIPTNVFRGFKNVGDDQGYMFAVLGGNDPGHVTWAPYVFESAAEHGLILCEDGSLVDTTKGEVVPEGKAAVAATTPDYAESLRTVSAEDLAVCIVLHEALAGDSAPPDLRERAVIGESSPEEGIPPGKMAWPHGFHLRRLAVDPGSSGKRHTREEEEVFLMQAGTLTLEFSDGNIELKPGDVFTTPIGQMKTISNFGAEIAEAYIVRGGDHPAPSRIVD